VGERIQEEVLPVLLLQAVVPLAVLVEAVAQVLLQQRLWRILPIILQR